MKNTKKSLVKAATHAAKPKQKKAAVSKARTLNTGPSNMKLILTTHNVTLTEAIENHIISRIEQLEHLDPRAIDARVVVEHDHSKVSERQFKCSIRLTEPGPDLFAEDALPFQRERLHRRVERLAVDVRHDRRRLPRHR